MIETGSTNWLSRGRILCLWKNTSKMRNAITGIMKNRRREYFGEVSNSLRSSHRSYWCELNTLIPWLIWNQFPKIWGRKVLIFIFKMFLTLLLPHSLTIGLCDGRVRKVYIRVNLMKFSGQIFYDFLHCYQIKLVWASWDLIGSSSRLLVNLQLIHIHISLITPF